MAHTAAITIEHLGAQEWLADARPADGTARLEFDLPMPGIARIRLSAGRATVRHG